MKIRKLVSFVAPALAVGLILVSQAQGRVSRQAPSRQAQRLEATINAQLAKENFDIRVEQRLINQQLRAFQTGNVNLFNRLQLALNRNAQVLAFDLHVVTPRKDNLMTTLGSIAPNSKQVAMFLIAASQRESYATTLLNYYLSRPPLTPPNAF